MPADALWKRVQDSLERQGMMRHLEARLLRVEPGLVEIALPYSDKVSQQQDGFHGGAMGALADIAGGYAGLTVAPEGMEVTTAEYKINFLAGFTGGELRAIGRVIKGRQAPDCHHGRGRTCGRLWPSKPGGHHAADPGAGAKNLLIKSLFTFHKNPGDFP